MLDASVAVKLVLVEPLAHEARTLIRDASRAHRRLIAPVVLLSEVTNAVYQHERRGMLSRRQADEALALFLALPFEFVSNDAIYTDAVSHAREHAMRATYDSQYAVLAEQLETDLWTGDAKFVHSLRGTRSRIRWIGDFAGTR